MDTSFTIVRNYFSSRENLEPLQNLISENGLRISVVEQLLGESMEVIFRHIGFVRLDKASGWEVFFWLTPELIVLPTSVTVYFLCRFLSQKSVVDEEEDASSSHRNAEAPKKNVDGTAKVLFNETSLFLKLINFIKFKLN